MAVTGQLHVGSLREIRLKFGDLTEALVNPPFNVGQIIYVYLSFTVPFKIAKKGKDENPVIRHFILVKIVNYIF